MTTLKIKPDTKEIGEWYRNHCYKYAGDIGLDLFCPNELIIQSHERTEIDFGIACEITQDGVGFVWKKKENVKLFDKLFSGGVELVRDITKDYRNLPFMLVPRSSISKTPLIMTNGIGLIDTGFRGQLKANVLNASNYHHKIQKKDRLFQIVLFNARRIDKIEIVDKLSETARSEAGIGSTGR